MLFLFFFLVIRQPPLSIFFPYTTLFRSAIFGDHVSPISDTTIMASIFAGSDHIAHVKTQMPYAIVTAVISGAMFLLYNVISNVYILLVIALVLQFLVLQFLTR